jgi:hypothetical protein
VRAGTEANAAVLVACNGIVRHEPGGRSCDGAILELHQASLMLDENPADRSAGALQRAPLRTH